MQYHVADDKEAGPEVDGAIGQDWGEGLKPPVDAVHCKGEHGNEGPAKRAEPLRRHLGVVGHAHDRVCRGRVGARAACETASCSARAMAGFRAATYIWQQSQR